MRPLLAASNLILVLALFCAECSVTRDEPDDALFRAVVQIKQKLQTSKSSEDLQHAGMLITRTWALTAMHVFQAYVLAKNTGELKNISITVADVEVSVLDVVFPPAEAASLAAKTNATFSPALDAALVHSSGDAFGAHRFALVVDIIPTAAQDNCYAVAFEASSTNVPGKMIRQHVDLVSGEHGCKDFVNEYQTFDDDSFRVATPASAHHVCAAASAQRNVAWAAAGGPLVCALPGAGALAFGVASAALPAHAGLALYVFPGALEPWIAAATGAPRFVDIASRANPSAPEASVGAMMLLVGHFVFA